MQQEAYRKQAWKAKFDRQVMHEKKALEITSLKKKEDVKRASKHKDKAEKKKRVRSFCHTMAMDGFGRANFRGFLRTANSVSMPLFVLPIISEILSYLFITAE